MKWSTPLLVASSGILVTADQVVPLLELVKTMSFAFPALMKRESDQATKTLPAPSISAVGRAPLRMPPASVWWLMPVMVVTLPQLTPPLVDDKAPTAVSLALSRGTTTVPLGWTTGCPPIPAMP